MTKKNNDISRTEKYTLPTHKQLFSKFGSERMKFSMKCSVKRGDPESTTMSWMPVPGSTLNLRVGPNYSYNKRKAPSGSALYEVVYCRAFKSYQRTPLTTMIDNMPLPYEELFPNGCVPDIYDERIPHVIILAFELPYKSPNILYPKTDGKGGEIIFYLKPSKEFIEESNALAAESTNLTRDDRISASTRLFTTWCEKAETNSDWSGRFKVIAHMKSLEKFSFANLLRPYNGKPVLISKSGMIKKGVTREGFRFLEFGANVHKWCYLFKKSLVYLLPKFKDLKFTLGIVIEGREDEELPECALQSTHIQYFNPDNMPVIPPEFQIPPL